MPPGRSCSPRQVNHCVCSCRSTPVEKMVNVLDQNQPNAYTIYSCLIRTVKSGIDASAAPSLFKYISANLKHLQPVGIMTIGAYGFDYSNGPNPDFVALMQAHRAICAANDLPPDALQVSMGMSNDYDKAVRSTPTAALD